MTTRNLQAVLDFYPASRKSIFDFKKSLLCAHRRKLQCKFLRRCREECVIPNSILPKSLQKLRDSQFGKLENMILDIHIDNAKKETRECFLQANRLRREFLNSVPQQFVQIILDWIYNHLRREIDKVKRNHSRKLSSLINGSPWNSYGDGNNVMNISSKQLSSAEICALELGLKFNNPSKKPDILQIFKSFYQKEKVTDNEDENRNLTLAKGVIYGAYIQYSDYNFFPKRFNVALQNLRKDEDIHITKADKANVIVVMDKEAYIEKMNELLRDRNTYEELRSDPVERVSAEFHRNIREIFSDNQFLIKKFQSIGSKLPYLYGNVKTHKQGHPMRPIISTIGSVSYFLSKFLVNLLKPLIGSISSSHIKNSNDFVDKVKSAHIDSNSLFVSFDVKSLFTNVPVEDVLHFLNIELRKYVYTIPVDSVIRLIRLCVIDTCFVFEGKFYKQKFGMQMGNCLSPVLSNIYMEFFEKRIANAIIPDDVYWVRYVDDIFAIVKRHLRVQDFLNDLNSLVETIKFEVEEETEGCLNFLDVKVIKIDNMTKFKIFRKPTNNNLIINAKSTHMLSVKRSALRSMFLRALNIVSPEFLDEEFSYIRDIGVQNHFRSDEIDTCLELAKKSYYRNDKPSPFNLKTSLVLPFHPCLENTTYPLKRLNIDVVFSYRNTIGRTIIRNTPKYDAGIVYRVPCECGKHYLGQTCKKLSKRLNQHKEAIRTNSMSNAINKHTYDCDKPISWSNSDILYKCTDFTLRNILESALIQAGREHNFNHSKGIFNIDPLCLHVATQQYKFRKKLPI